MDKKTYENPYDLAIEINIPNELRLELSAKYLQLYTLITEIQFNLFIYSSFLFLF